MKRFAVLLALTAALATPAVAQAGYWSWGYNYISSTTIQVESGWNYWYEGYIDKRNGALIDVGYNPGGGCYFSVTDAYANYFTPSGLGCGGYVDEYTKYDFGSASYLQIQAWA
jgi:hypothetical protein